MKHTLLKLSGVGRVLSLATIAVALVGCASTQQPHDVQESGFLHDYYPLMKEGSEGKSLRVYFNPKVDSLTSGDYNKIYLDKVTLFFGPDSEMNDAPREQLEMLANDFTGVLAQQLSKDYQIVQRPGPNTLRIQTAITDAQATSGLKALSFVPWGVPGLKFAIFKSNELATGKPVLSGDATVEIKMSDAQTSEVLFAAVDRRVGGRLGGGWESWTDVENAFQYWAEKVRYGLCKRIGQQSDCPRPKEE